MTATKFCSKCRAALRLADAAYCTVCGAPQRPNDGGPGWNTRIEQASESPSYALSFLWLIAFPLAPFAYPFLLLKADNRLRRHIQGYLASSAMQSPRVTQTPEGRAIVERLGSSAGVVTTRGIVPLLLSLLVLSICVYVLFIFPALAPRPIRYEPALESVIEANGAYGYVYINSESDYDRFWENYPTWAYDDIWISTTSYSQRTAAKDLPVYDSRSYDVSSYDHPPYEYLARTYNDVLSYQRISSIRVHWEDTAWAGVLFWICALVLHLIYLVGGLTFWFRFARHRQAEVLAAAYAVGDPGLHDRLLPLVRQRNALLTWLVIPLAVTGLHMIIFPVLSAAMFSRHSAWEQRSGIRSGLAGAGR